MIWAASLPTKVGGKASAHTNLLRPHLWDYTKAKYVVDREQKKLV